MSLFFSDVTFSFNSIYSKSVQHEQVNIVLSTQRSMDWKTCFHKFLSISFHVTFEKTIHTYTKCSCIFLTILHIVLEYSTLYPTRFYSIHKYVPNIFQPPFLTCIICFLLIPSGFQSITLNNSDFIIFNWIEVGFSKKCYGEIKIGNVNYRLSAKLL